MTVTDIRTERLRAALGEANALLEQAQAILARYLEPESGWNEKRSLDELLSLLDGPEQRRIQTAVREALEEVK